VNDCPIAVTGMGIVAPGALDVVAFWRNIVERRDLCREVPAGRWVLPPDRARARTPGTAGPDEVISTRGFFVDPFRLSMDGLDIDLRLLAQLDPLYHFALHAGRDAFRAGGGEALERSRIGVILAAIALPTDGSSALSRAITGGAFERDLLQRTESAGRASEVHPLNAYPTALPAAIIARALGLGGGSYTLDAACASSLYAIKLACDELRAGRADAMLAGGVSRPDCLYTQMGFSQLKSLSPSGRCAPFDAGADGLVVGEGAGVVMLRRLDDAIAQGVPIYGVIRGIGLSNDIGGSLIAPDSEGQLRAMRAAYESAGWRPDDVELIECHGTGTPLGDAVELTSLRTLWADAPASARCAIGSVKSMVGHLLTGAGSVGLIKTLMAMKEGVLPPSLNYEKPSLNSPLSSGPFRVQTEPQAWREPSGKARRAAVSAFGFGGINAHVLVEQHANGGGMAAASGGRVLPRASAHAHGRTHADVTTVGMAPDAKVPIAIVGMDARFGKLVGLRAFQDAVFSDGSADSQSPWQASRQWHTGSDACVIDELSIAIGEFRVPPHEIPEILPQQLLMMQSVAAAMRDAGFTQRERRPRMGAYIGIALDMQTNDFDLRWWLPMQARRWAQALGIELDDTALDRWVERLREAISPPLNATRTLGALGGTIASRIAREFGLGGPCFGISADAASGLRALEAAVRALQLNELDAAIVGAVDLAAEPRAAAARSGLIADAQTGDGAGGLVLKRLTDATAAGDRVYAVIRGIGAASGGGIDRSVANAVREVAAHRASLDAQGRPHADATAIGMAPDTSIERIVGDCGAATGMADLIASALCLHDGLRPGGEAWLRNRTDGPRRMGVTSTTFDGNCVHVLLEESQTPDANRRDSVRRRPQSLALFAITGNDVATLDASISALGRMADEENPSAEIEQIARRWFVRNRKTHEGGLAIAIFAADLTALRARIAAARRMLSGELIDPRLQRDIYFASMPVGPGGQVAFVYPGSGSHYPGMGRGIASAFPELMHALDARTDRLADQFMPTAEECTASQPEIRRLILAQVTHGILMTDLMRRLGLRPDAAIGYSLGESAALLSLEAWPDRDELFRRLMQSSLFASDLAGPCDAARRAWKLGDSAFEWKTVVVPKPPDVVRQAIADRPHVRLLIVNTPGECVIGGERAAVDAFLGEMRWRGVMIEGVPTVHCDVARIIEREYLALHDLPTTPPAGIRFYSAASGAAYNVTRAAAAESITAQAIHGFDFPALIRRAYDDGVRVFIEAGPGGSCTRMIGRILEAVPHVAVALNEAGVDEYESMLRGLAALIAQRVSVDLSFLYDDEVEEQRETTVESARRIVVPTRRTLPGPPLPEGGGPPQQGDRDTRGSINAGLATSRRSVHATPRLGVGSNWAAVAANTAAATATAHAAYLRFSQNAMTSMGDIVAAQAKLLTGGGVARANPRPQKRQIPQERQIATPVAFTREQCLEFAVGSAARVLGPLFAEVDSYPARVRLPDEPLMLVDRIVSVEGRLGGLINGGDAALNGGRLVTEHDVHDGAWYLDGGRAPVCITVEAGQADLFLSGYLGIDLAVKGLRTYRLLDATVTFQRGLPRPGEVIRYDIRINKFVRRGETYLFFFEFDGTIDGQPMLTMRDGCAGFFTAEEVAAAGGVVISTQDQAKQTGRQDESWKPLVPVARESYDDGRLSALRRGDLAACFGPAFENLPLSNPVQLPDGRMKLLDRVVDLDPTGGRFGLGFIRAELDIHPDDWFLTCHFVDDMVMPGTLMYECCVHTLRVLLMRYGWVGEHDEIAHEPVAAISSGLKCRGPVTPKTKKVTYEVEIKEIGYRPEPYVIADALMYADGARVVRMTDMSLQLTGMTRERLEEIWGGSATQLVRTRGPHSPGHKPAIYDRERILAFAIGTPSEAFGEPYRIFDDKRKIARLPGPPFAFMDRVVEVEPPPWKLAAGGWIEAEYDVPPDAWYFAANRQPTMPFAVLLETALQPCGWLAAYLGSALRSETDLKFRNLGGTATLHEEVRRDTGTLTTRVRMTRVSEAGGMIIQDFDMRMTCEGRPIYDGTTQFGFFTSEALAKQVGIRDAAARLFKPTTSDVRDVSRFDLLDVGSNEPGDWELGSRVVDASQSHWQQAASGTLLLPGRAFRMIERIDALRVDGGPHGLGFVLGSTTVDPSAWFFKAHFYQDPVWPGSLGLESFLQLLKVYAIERWGERLARTHRFEGIATGLPHTWAYRGQIIPTNKRVEVSATITRCEDGDAPLVMANGFLTVDGTTIYEMRDFGLRMVT